MRKFLPTLLIAGAVALAGCVITPVTGTAGSGGRGNGEPVIQAFTHSPTGQISKDDAIVFNVVAHDPEQQPLSYSWSATRGTLSTTTGQAVSWRPTKADGSFDPGLAQVTVLVSDGAHAKAATTNIMINAEGQATVQGTPGAAATPAASATPAPTPAPSATPAPDDTATEEAAATEEAEATAETAASDSTATDS
ncbi:MAG: hypothetical protein ACLGIN_09690 [Candidatus Sericytochromatia bacterium]